MKKIVVEKSARRLTLLEDGRAVLTCRAALGDHPAGAKRRSGDGRTPEGDYYVCLKKAAGKFGPALGLSYPSPADGEAGGADAALAASLFHYRELEIRTLKEYLKGRGVPVRL